MKKLLLLFITVLSLSCSRGYYNVTQTYYNYEEAYNLVHGLSDGILIVQIPCEKRKTQILTSLYQNETDPKKKEKYKNDLDFFKANLLNNQKALIEGTEKFYTFSNYAYIPDTLIQEFKNGERANIFINPDLSFRQEVSIDTNRTVMFLRNLRDYDELFIHKYDGSYPPNPFPYTSTLPTGNLNSAEFELVPETYDDKSILKAMIVVNKRLVDFYNYRKPPG